MTAEISSEPVVHANAERRPWYRIEDYLTIFIAIFIIGSVGLWSWMMRPENYPELVAQSTMVKQRIAKLDASSESYQDEKKALENEAKAIESKLAPMPFKNWLVRPGDWKSNPLDAFQKKGVPIYFGLAITFVVLMVVLMFAVRIMGKSAIRFGIAFACVFLMATLSYVLAGQDVIKAYNLEYALWALLLGLLVSNTTGLPSWLEPGARTELYIKTGLVLLGAEVLFNKLLALGLPGILISWVVTPVVLISTYLFGQYVLKIPSKSLNMVISADMSVCGVSAAVATAAACKAKKEELSLAIGLSLIFTVIMIVVQPYIVAWSGMGEIIGGAWIGGTIDSTGAVAAAGELVGDKAKDVAATVKMIQNILIGVIAFGVALYWVSFVERDATSKRPQVSEIWRRFPRFTLGFLGVSLILSYVQTYGIEGKMMVSSIVDGATKSIREWLFCLAFVSIGLESNFREYKHMLASGKPVVLYVVGQAFNLTLSFLMAWFVFTKLYPNAMELLYK
ncbi:YeiH family protein [Pirellulaceae bacterium SH467]